MSFKEDYYLYSSTIVEEPWEVVSKSRRKNSQHLLDSSSINSNLVESKPLNQINNSNINLVQNNNIKPSNDTSDYYSPPMNENNDINKL